MSLDKLLSLSASYSPASSGTVYYNLAIFCWLASAYIVGRLIGLKRSKRPTPLWQLLIAAVIAVLGFLILPEKNPDIVDWFDLWHGPTTPEGGFQIIFIFAIFLGILKGTKSSKKPAPGENYLAKRQQCMSLGFLLGIIAFVIYPWAGIAVYLAMIEIPHAYTIVSQSQFMGKRGTNRWRKRTKWAPLFMLPPLVAAAYTVVVGLQGNDLLGLGSLGSGLLVIPALFWLLGYFYLTPGGIMVGFFYPVQWKYRNDVFTKVEVVLYFVTVTLLCALMAVYGAR